MDGKADLENVIVDVEIVTVVVLASSNDSEYGAEAVPFIILTDHAAAEVSLLVFSSSLLRGSYCALLACSEHTRPSGMGRQQR